MRNMPESISISDFVSLANEDITSPGTSCFQSRMSECRNTVTALEEVRTLNIVYLPVQGCFPPASAAARCVWGEFMGILL